MLFAKSDTNVGRLICDVKVTQDVTKLPSSALKKKSRDSFEKKINDFLVNPKRQQIHNQRIETIYFSTFSVHIVDCNLQMLPFTLAQQSNV